MQDSDHVTLQTEVEWKDAKRLIDMKPGRYYIYPRFWFWVLMFCMVAIGFLLGLLAMTVPFII